jgi:hypothetical protein
LIKAFGKNVCILGCRGDVQNSDVTNLDLLSYEVYADLNVFSAPMLKRINKQINSRNVITADLPLAP